MYGFKLKQSSCVALDLLSFQSSSRSGTCTPCSRARVRAGPALWMSPLEKCFYIYTLYFLCRAQGRSKPAGADKKRQKVYLMVDRSSPSEKCFYIYTLYFLCRAQSRSKSAGADKKRQKTYNMRIPLRKYIFCHFFRCCRIHYESKECGGICLYWLTEVAYRSFEHTDVVVTRYVFVEAASDTLGVSHLSEYAAVRGCDSFDSVH